MTDSFAKSKLALADPDGANDEQASNSFAVARGTGLIATADVISLSVVSSSLLESSGDDFEMFFLQAGDDE